MTLRKSPCQERLELQFGGSYRLQTITVTGFRTRCYVDTNWHTIKSTSNVSWGSDVVYAAILSLPYSFCFRISIPCLKTSRREQPAISHPPAGQRSCLKPSHLAKLKRSHKGRSRFTRMGAQEWSKVEKKKSFLWPFCFPFHRGNYFLHHLSQLTSTGTLGPKRMWTLSKGIGLTGGIHGSISIAFGRGHAGDVAERLVGRHPRRRVLAYCMHHD